MSNQPEALRLADLLQDRWGVDGYVRDEAAAELCRLHQFAEDQIGRATAAEAALQMTKAKYALKLSAVEAQRDLLLEVLRDLVQLEADGRTEYESAVSHWDAARAAIKAVEEGK